MDIPVFGVEVEMIQSHTKLEPEQFCVPWSKVTENFNRQNISGLKDIKTYGLLAKKEHGACVFQVEGGGRCLIYSHRPLACQLFPYVFQGTSDPDTLEVRVDPASRAMCRWNYESGTRFGREQVLYFLDRLDEMARELS